MTVNLDSSTPTESINRISSLTMSVGFLLGGLFFAWNLLVIYAFSTMVDPALPAPERRAEIFNSFLFSDGIHQIFLVTAMFAAALICFALCGLKIWSSVTGIKPKSNNLTIPIGSVVVTLIVFGTICFVFS